MISNPGGLDKSHPRFSLGCKSSHRSPSRAQARCAAILGWVKCVYSYNNLKRTYSSPEGAHARMPLLWPRLAETINKINEIQSLNGQPRTYHSCLISKGEASFISIKAVPRTGIRKSPLEVHTSGMRLELLALITVERKCFFRRILYSPGRPKPPKVASGPAPVSMPPVHVHDDECRALNDVVAPISLQPRGVTTIIQGQFSTGTL